MAAKQPPDGLETPETAQLLAYPKYMLSKWHKKETAAGKVTSGSPQAVGNNRKIRLDLHATGRLPPQALS
jgi:hypothetical protein